MKYEDEKKRLCKQEITYRNCWKIINQLRNKLKEKTEIESDLKAKYQDIENSLDEANKKLYQISQDSQKNGISALDRVKGVAKSLIKKIKGK